ncbi:PTB domain-containing engulfment adapter protein 1 [Bagarius yarrelli]|uniref:PTB domain-containing engulfment adapter protein 1 n=1 Tax=Bagarius yarrelli TaxID=175774 RepID=A0A556V901_BAGYA|nr:PTB domain-containing engulfment adapter protein 1 [Bagarius yarrelli]
MSDEENDSEISFSVKFLGRVEVVRPAGMEILMESAAALQFMLYSCTLSSVSFCAVHQFQSKLFGFVTKHPALDSHHCYVFQSKKFSHLLVSMIGEAFRVSNTQAA